MSKWALILGASTGHGGATAISLAEKGYGIIGFHFDRGETKKEAEKTPMYTGTTEEANIPLLQGQNINPYPHIGGRVEMHTISIPNEGSIIRGGGNIEREDLIPIRTDADAEAERRVDRVDRVVYNIPPPYIVAGEKHPIHIVCPFCNYSGFTQINKHRGLAAYLGGF